jgi:hypothetical protein
LSGRRPGDSHALLWQAALWAAAGALFGMLMWFFNEKSYLKQQGKREEA